MLASLSTVGFRGLSRLWRRLLDAADGLEARVVATVGPSIDPSTLRAPTNVEVHRRLPHAQLLPRTSAVVSHRGHGTAMAALAHGVPLLVLPIEPTFDQPSIGRAVAHAGVGSSLPRWLSPAAIRTTLEHLLADGERRDASVALGARMREFDGRHGGTDLLESLREEKPGPPHGDHPPPQAGRDGQKP